MSSFHLPIGDMTITLDDVSCLLHLPIRGRLLDHKNIGREEVVDMMVTHLGVDHATYVPYMWNSVVEPFIVYLGRHVPDEI